MRKITQPDWLKKLPGNAYLNSQEMVRLFGYSDKTSKSFSKERINTTTNKAVP